VESILKLLHDFDCVDLAKFREKLPQFPDALSTSRLWPNEDIQVIRSKFVREFWLASGKEAVKSIARLTSERFCLLLFIYKVFASYFLHLFLYLF
jgi:hypothetical protein